MKEIIFSGDLQSKEGIEIIMEIYKGRMTRTSEQLINDLECPIKLLSLKHRHMQINNAPAEITALKATGVDRVQTVEVKYLQNGQERTKTYLAQTFYEL